MRSAVVLIGLAAVAIGCKSKSAEPAASAGTTDAARRIDARQRPDAVMIDAGPADARPYVDLAPCPYDTQELEAAARAVWGPPPDAGVQVRCVPAIVSPDQAWILYGYAGLDNRYEVHVTVVKASPGHSVIADSFHRTTQSKAVESEYYGQAFTAADLDDDGVDELVEYHDSAGTDGATAGSLVIHAIRNGALVTSAPLPLHEPGCFADYDIIPASLYNREPPQLRLTVTTSRTPGCLAKGRHRMKWDASALVLTPSP